MIVGITEAGFEMLFWLADLEGNRPYSTFASHILLVLIKT